MTNSILKNRERDREIVRRSMLKERLRNMPLEQIRQDSLTELETHKLQKGPQRVELERRIMKNEAVTQYKSHLEVKDAK